MRQDSKGYQERGDGMRIPFLHRKMHAVLQDHFSKFPDRQADNSLHEKMFIEQTLKMYTARFLPKYPYHFQPCGNRKEAGLKVLAGLMLGTCMTPDNQIQKFKTHKKRTAKTATVAYPAGAVRAIATWTALKEMKRKNVTSEELLPIVSQAIPRYERKYHVSCNPLNEFDGSLALGSCIAGAFSDDSEEVIRLAALSMYTPNWNPEGMRGGIVLAICIWLALHGAAREEICQYAIEHYGNDTAPIEYCFSHGRVTVEMTMDDLLGMPSYQLTDPSCMVSVPEAILSFFRAYNFDTAVRASFVFPCDLKIVPLMTGALAGAFYDIPDEILLKYMEFLPIELRARIASVIE